MTDLTQKNLEEMARLSAEAQARMNEAVEFARENGLPLPTFNVASEYVQEDWDASYEEDWDASWDDSYC
jgi:hypothetical protein